MEPVPRACLPMACRALPARGIRGRPFSSRTHGTITAATMTSSSSVARPWARRPADSRVPGMAGHLLLHGHRAASSSSTSEDAGSGWADSQAESAPAARIHLRGLDGTPAALEAALVQMRDLRPQQVMLESCAQRRALAERRSAAVAAAAAKEAQKTNSQGHSQGQEAEAAASATSRPVGQPMSHADAVSKVHGGISGRDIVSIAAAAGSVGAQVYVVDREYQETQNRVARRLWIRPKEMLAFTRCSLASFQPTVAGQKATHASDLLKEQCPAVHEILVAERVAHMTAEINRRAVRGADVLVLCTTERVGGLQRCLGQPEAALSEGSGGKTGRVWPFLLVFVYLLVPIYGTVFVSWRISRRLGDLFSEHVSSGIGFPLPGEGDAPAGSEPPQGVSSQSSAG